MGPHPAVAEVRRAVRTALAGVEMRVLVACSGGADSLALAAAILALCAACKSDYVRNFGLLHTPLPVSRVVDRPAAAYYEAQLPKARSILDRLTSRSQ